MFDKSNFERIKVQMDGAHYQPSGQREAYVIGISWDKENGRPCLHLLYPEGEEDYIPLSELGHSHILGSVTILNEIVKC